MYHNINLKKKNTDSIAISDERKPTQKIRNSEVGNAKNIGISKASEVRSPEVWRSQKVLMSKLESGVNDVLLS